MTGKTEAGARTGRIELDRKLRWVPISKMRVSERAQRVRKQGWVDHLAANFNFDVMNIPTLNLRDGWYYICDGQHCIWALTEMGYGDQQVQCWVYEGLTEQQEAGIFLDLNKNLAVVAFDKFRVAVVNARDIETNVDRLVRANRLSISREHTPGAISAVGTLTRVYERMNDDANFARVLRIIRDSFGDGGFTTAVIDGIGHLVVRYNGLLDEARTVVRLSAMHGGVHGLVNKAETLRRTTGAAKSVCVAAAAVEQINGGSGGKKLPSWWK